MKFKITKNADGSITVHDYPIVAAMAAGEKGIETALDAEWMDSALVEIKNLNRSAFLFDGHNEIDQKTGEVKRYAPIVGRAEPGDLYRDGEIVKARNMRVADPRYIALFERDLLGNHSAEFLFKSKRILGVAHIGGIPGHQDAKLPEMRPMARDAAYDAELASLAKGEPIIRGSVTAQEKAMFSKEQTDAINTIVADAIKASLPEAIKTLNASGADLFSNDLDAKLKAKIEEGNQKRDLEDCRKRHILILSARDNSLWSESALAEHFSKCETVREIESEYKRLALINNKTDAMLTLQSDADLASPDYKLRKEARDVFSRRKDDPEFKKLYASEDQYVSEYVAANKDAA